MIKDEAEKPADISKILRLALEYNPSLAMRDISTPRMWVKSGCDIELDILPAMSDIVKKPRNRLISTFSYFTNAVMAAKDKRAIIPEVLKAVEQKESPEAVYERKIQGWLWKQKRGMFMFDHELEEIERWKQKSPTRENEA